MPKFRSLITLPRERWTAIYTRQSRTKRVSLHSFWTINVRRVFPSVDKPAAFELVEVENAGAAPRGVGFSNDFADYRLGTLLYRKLWDLDTDALLGMREGSAAD